MKDLRYLKTSNRDCVNFFLLVSQEPGIEYHRKMQEIMHNGDVFGSCRTYSVWSGLLSRVKV